MALELCGGSASWGTSAESTSYLSKRCWVTPVTKDKLLLESCSAELCSGGEQMGGEEELKKVLPQLIIIMGSWWMFVFQKAPK